MLAGGVVLSGGLVGCDLLPTRRDSAATPYGGSSALTSSAGPRTLPASLVYNRSAHDLPDDLIAGAAANPANPAANSYPLAAGPLILASELGARRVGGSGYSADAAATKPALHEPTLESPTDAFVENASPPDLIKLPSTFKPTTAAQATSAASEAGALPAANPAEAANLVAATKPTDAKGPTVAVSAPPAPAVVRELTLAELLAKARAKAREKAESAGPAWILREKLLAWLDTESKMNDSEPAAGFWIALLNEVVAREPDELTWDQTRQSEIDRAMGELESRRPMTIREIRLCDEVSGFASYTESVEESFKAGGPILVYCEPANVRQEPVSRGYRSRLRTRIEIMADQNGKEESVWRKDLGGAEEVSQERRRDYYINFRLNIPETLAAGDYRLVVTIEDLLGGSEARNEVALRISE